MNDPGLDEPIADHAEDVENIKRDEEEAEEEDESDYLEPAYVFLFCFSFFCSFSGVVLGKGIPENFLSCTGNSRVRLLKFLVEEPFYIHVLGGFHFWPNGCLMLL